MIELTCSSCGASLKVPDQLAGKKGKCQKCGAVIVVPQPDTAQALANEPQAGVATNASGRMALGAPESHGTVAVEPPPAQGTGGNVMGAFASRFTATAATLTKTTNTKMMVHMILKWVALGVSGIFFIGFFSETESAPRQAVAAGMACFFGIVSRIMQAEEHAARSS